MVGIDDDFAPLCFRDERGELAGFDIEMAKEAGKRLGVLIKFQPIDWDNKRDEINSGHVDMIWNGLDITDKRKEYMIFSKPYMEDRQILLVRRDSDLDIHSEYDIEGKIIGTQGGSSSDDYINANETLKSHLKEHKTYDKFNEAVQALINGDIEVVVCDEIVARYETNLDPEHLKIINVKVGEIADTGVGFRKDNVELRDSVQKVLDAMIKDNTARKISIRWFHADLIKSSR